MKGETMENLKDKILSGKIKMYFVDQNTLAIYGKTYEVRNELKNIGAIWNFNKKRLELNETDFKKLDKDIIKKVLEVRDK